MPATAAAVSPMPPVTPRDWFMASRPMYFAAAAIPIMLGSSMAATRGHFSTGIFALTFTGSIFLQAAVNYLNTYGDFKTGVDTKESVDPVNDHLVSGKIQPEAMKRAGLYCIAAGGLCGLAPMYYGGPTALACGILGAAGAACYTTFCPYKYCALGVPFIFMLMGPLMVVPAWAVQGAAGIADPLLASMPIACLVANIAHANDIRDIEHDREAKIATPAALMGRANAIVVLKGFIGSAYAFLIASVATKVLSPFALLPLLLLPMVWSDFGKGLSAKSERSRIVALVECSGKLHCLFGVLMCVGVTLSIWF